MKMTMKKWISRAAAIALSISMTATCALAESVAIIGGADGPTQVVVTSVAAPVVYTESQSDAEREITASVSAKKAGVTINNLSYGSSAALVGGKMFILSDNMLLRLNRETETLECVAQYVQDYRYYGQSDLEMLDAQELERVQKTPSMIFANGETLCGLSIATGTFGAIGADGLIENAVALDWSQMYTQYGIRDIQSAQVIDGGLYACLAPLYSDMGYSSSDMRVTRFDLTTGEAKELALEGDYTFTAYKDGKLLAYSPYGEDVKGIMEFDPVTGQLGAVVVPFAGYGAEEVEGIDYNGGGITYDAATDTLYFVQNSRIYAYADGKRSEVAFIPVDYASNVKQAQVIDEQYFCTSWDGVYLYSLRAEDQPERELRISGGYMEDTIRAYTEETGVPVLFDNSWYSGSEAVRNDMLSGSTDNDIYVVSVEAGARSLIEKGYVQDISSSQALMDDVSRMYPAISDALMLDGKLYGYPQSMSVSLWSVTPQMWELFDLGDYPQTFAEYVELIDTWYTDYADDNTDYQIMSLYSGKQELFLQALQHYIYQYERPDAPLSFNTSVFRETMQAIEALEIEEIDWENLSAEEEEEMWEQMSRPTLFNINAYETVENATTFYTMPDGSYEEAPLRLIAPPVFEEGAQAVIPATLTLYIVNPESENIDLAIDFLEYWAENADASLRYEIHTDLSEPVRQQHYEESRKYYEEWIAESEALMAEAEESDKQSYQENIDWMRAELEELDATSWRISPESVAHYRELAPSIVIPLDSLFLSGESSGLAVLQDVFMRYLGGQIDLDTFIREADQKIKMVYLESM